MLDPVLIAGYLALFVAVGAAFLAVNLIVGWLVRPRMPNKEKLEVYECGEPAIGSSFVQFDLRFYVVALLFIIFDVEVALFFPWATVFGKATQLTDPGLVSVIAVESELIDPVDAAASAGHQRTLPGNPSLLALSPAGEGLFRELGFREPVVPVFPVTERQAAVLDESLRGVPEREGHWSVQQFGSLLARTAISDMVVFYAVLLVGFAYVWYRGDLDWVRAVSASRSKPPVPLPSTQKTGGPSGASVLSA